MSTVGYIAGGGTAESGQNYANQVACQLTMPVNGWITNAHAVFGGWNTNPWSALCIWAQNNGQLIWASAGFTPGVGPSQQNAGVPNIRVSGGAPFWLGFWRDPSADAEWTTDTAVATNWAACTNGGGPGPFSPSIGAYGPGQLSAYVDYAANATPNQGVWQSPTPSGTISDTNPVFSGTTPQNPADSAYESVSQIRWQITRTDTGQTVFDRTWSVNAAIGSWSHRPSDFGLTLQAGVPYSSMFSYADSWGAWSGWVATPTTFTVNSGPNAPVPSSPTGKVNAVSGLSFTANYTHGSSLSAQSVQVQVLDASGSTVLRDSGVVTQTVASGSNYSVAQWFTGLSWGTQYTWWTRAQDTSGVWGPWSAKLAFNTDTAPNTPVPSAPTTGAVISGGSVVLSASFSDPDGDALASLVWDLYDLTAAAEVAGYPATVTGSFPSGSTQSRDVTSALTVGHAYQWRAQASDGTLTGAWSPWWTFNYTTPPSVTITSPTASQVLTSASASVAITYSGSAAKAYDRTYVYDVTGGQDLLVYDSGPIAGARTSWSLPFSTVQNGHSYSIQVAVVDANSLVATSAAVAFSASWTVTPLPKLQLLVDGVDRSANMVQDQWSLSQEWGRQGDTGMIGLVDEVGANGLPNFYVRPMATVELRDLNLGVLMFGGVVSQPKRVQESPTQFSWTLSCQSPAIYLQSRIITSEYENWTADAIVRDMLAQANCGITGNHISPGPVIAEFKGLNHTVAQALQKLCHLASTTSTYGWWVDGNSDLHFASTTQADAQPSGVVLTDRVSAAATAVNGFYQTGSQTYYQWDATSLKTRILVQGGDITRTFTEQFVGDGTTRAFRLSYPYKSGSGPVVLVNGTALPVSDQSGATTPWILTQGAPGVWSVSVQPGGAPAASGAIVTVTYEYVMPVVAQAQSNAGVAAVLGPNQGLFDSLVTDSTLTGLDSAQARALRELNEYALPQERVVLATTEDWPGWLTVGQSFEFQNALLPDSQNGWAAGMDDIFLVVQMRSQGVGGGYRVNTLTAVRI